ncbi:acyltransferase [Vibrio fluvialis]|nr:acyltransferase [Vibrio fluvialis]MBY7775824.1 acyltransferase [Vibrio fluvialis]MBY7780164.1 acyltransferase [Vibrio fluvialis]MBY7989427.1 acyltransferase [Vibrio fluvialis]MBY7993762.1 acyltransferase [Vibrio fluvialis]
MNFRYDINGLRAIAVIAVVLFHFNPAWVPGGFVGVDVFFVISGFLMTGIIFRGLKNESFNLFKFYVARANRIIPALAVLCLVLLIFGWFYLTPLDYKVLGKHVASSMGFVSNVIYWRESGYFDAASHEKWLLHTWSLSVEWQFYILYPIVLVALKKFLSLENLKRLIVVGTILGFVLSVIATIKWPNPAYYLLPTRAWEMMMGGVAFLYPWSLSESKKKILEIIGLALILGSYAFVSSSVPWPGHFALLPVLGAYLMIASNQQSSFITNNPLFQYLGKWSYSIYLWHWPVVVYGYYFDVQCWALYGLPLSVIFGFASFRFVESQSFHSFYSWRNVLNVKPLWPVLFLVPLGYFAYLTNGFLDFKYSGNKKNLLLEQINAIGDWDYPSSELYYHGAMYRELRGDEVSKYANLFIGDSLVEQYYPKVNQLVKNGDMPTTYFFTEGGCMPLEGLGSPGKNCRNLYKVRGFIEDKVFDKVFISGYWAYYLSDLSTYEIKNRGIKLNESKGRSLIVDDLVDLISEIKTKSNHVYYILPTPYGEEFDPNETIKKIIKDEDLNYYGVDSYRDKYKQLYIYIDEIVKRTGMEIIDPISYLCDRGECKTMDKSGKPYYKDRIHLRPWYVIDKVDYLTDLN